MPGAGAIACWPGWSRAATSTRRRRPRPQPVIGRLAGGLAVAGAACVVGLMQALAARKAKVDAVGVIGLGEARAPALLGAVENALGDRGLRSTAQAVREECDAMAPIGAAVTVLEEVAEGMSGE